MGKLISEWNLDDPNPTAYGNVLQKMARSKAKATTSNPYTDCEPERILQMGLELSTSGPRFDNALDALLNSARLDLLMNLLDKAPDQEFAESVWSYLDSHDILWAALSEARIDIGVVERIVRRKRLSAIDPILDVAERAKDPRVRDRLLDVLTELGDDVGPYIVRRLEGARAEMRRDLFLMLGKLSTIPEGLDPSRFLMNSDAGVRREAVRLLLKFLETREHAIVAGVTDTDDRAVYYALTAAQEAGCPPRALAIRVVAAADSGAGPMVAGKGRTSQMMRAVTSDANPGATAVASKKTLDWLVARVVEKSRFFNKWKLRDKSPEMLASLSALASYWGHDPEVQEILNLAIKTNDPEIRKSMTAQRVTGKFKAITE